MARLIQAVIVFVMELASCWCIVKLAIDSTEIVGGLNYFQWFVIFSLLIIKARMCLREGNRQ